MMRFRFAARRRILVAASLTSVAATIQLAPRSAALADAEPSGVLSLRIALRNSQGQVGCLLFDSEAGFPANPSAAAQRRWCPVRNAESLCSFDPMPAGTYAFVCFHDQNANGKLDTGFLGVPTEPTLASNGAKGVFGPPRFKDAKFSFSGSSTEMRLRLGL